MNLKPTFFLSNATIYADDAWTTFTVSPNGCGDDDSMDVTFNDMEAAENYALSNKGRWISHKPEENIKFNRKLIQDMEEDNYFGTEPQMFLDFIKAQWLIHMNKLGFYVGDTYQRDDFDAYAQIAIERAINKPEMVQA